MPLTPSEIELRDLLLARVPIVVVKTHEERLVEGDLRRFLADHQAYNLFFWSVTRGLTDINDEPVEGAECQDPISILKYILAYKQQGLFLLRDYHPFLQDVTVRRLVRDVARDLVETKHHRHVVIVSPELEVHTDIEKSVSIIDYALPDRATIREVVEGVQSSVKRQGIQITADTDTIVEACLGLTLDETNSALAKSLQITSRKTNNPDFRADIILREKKFIVRKKGTLEFYEPEGDLSVIGGLDNLKAYVRKRQLAYTPEAREFRLPMPRGILLVGVPGCGKSVTAKAVAKTWEQPLLRLDVGRIMGSLIGSSEANIREALKLAEAVAPSVLWLN